MTTPTKTEIYKPTPQPATQQNHETLKLLVDDVLAFGDLLIVANKGCGKTHTLMQLARAFRQCLNTQVVVFETFPKWMHSFDKIPYFFVENEDVVTTETFIELNENDYFVRTSKDYTIRRGKELTKALQQQDLLFTLGVEDTDRLSFFIASVVYSYYRQHYLTAYKYGCDAIQKHVVFICEESQNLFDSSVISKKLFNKLRKMFSESRNLKLHFILATQRLVDLNTKIRGRTRLMIGRVNVDDFDLKINRLLRYTQHRSDILNLPIGQFLYVPQDKLIQFSKFQQIGKPYKLPQPQRQAKNNLLSRFVDFTVKTWREA